MGTLNDQPFEHRCRNGTVFRAKRCDFVGGVEAFAPEHLSTAEMMADAAEMGAWHWANIVPELNGFTGPGEFTVYRRELSKHERMERLLAMPLMEFFTRESLEAHAHHSSSATRAFNGLEAERDSRNEHPSRSSGPINSVGEFLENCSVADLLKVPNMREKSVGVIVRRLKSDGLELKEK